MCNGKLFQAVDNGYHIGLYRVPEWVTEKIFATHFEMAADQEHFDESNEIGAVRVHIKQIEVGL